ncbi:sensor histidine kinase [Cryobacterium lactosi]|uniref:sensor histidine kinase n=1 Tax=Cryobacterium lactosi TaxID=1259202 RepID=UPI00240844C0|nr:HAMP domain-containing sensor histidine kinase [Cryobacterium lactosi]
MSVRLKLTLSYAGLVVLAGGLLLGVVWVFLLRYVPEEPITGTAGFAPNRSDLVEAFLPAVAAVLIFLLAFGLVGGWVLAGALLAPLVRVTDAARKATAGSLSHRVQLPGRQDEFRELADSFDTMLSRLEAHVAEQQRFAANASHELRTPLAITRTLLEVGSIDPNRNTDELISRLRVVNTRAIDLTEALLLLSRADRRSFARECVDLSLVAEEAAETLLPLAEERGVAVELESEIASVLGSQALLLQLATNLLHNAIVHNLPTSGSVWLSAAVRPSTVTLIVENTGAELSPDLVATLTEPFQRGSGRIRNHDAGLGLGLAIAKSIVEAHDGRLTLTPRPGGGLSIRVELPAVGADVHQRESGLP